MTKAQAQIARVVASLKVLRLWARAHAILVALVLIAAFAALWLLEHDARLRREFELQRLRTETKAEVADLRARGAAAMGELQENARQIESLESRRRGLQRDAQDLRQRLTLLREQERVRVQQAGTLAPRDLAQRVAARLGPEALRRDSGLGVRDSGKEETGKAKMETGRAAVSASPSSIPENSGTQRADSSSTQPPAPGTPPPGEFPVSSFQFPLNEAGLRQVETAFLQLDACREQSMVKDQMVANCEARAGAAQTQIEKLNDSVNQLQEAVRLKDQIAVRTEAEHRAELQAARGTWRSRFVRALKYLGVGVVIGVAIR
jgi:TolA-binding protein